MITAWQSPGGVDVSAKKALRRAQVKDNVRADFDFGPERQAWEAVFDDATMRTLNRGLAALPKSVRKDKRSWIFEHAPSPTFLKPEAGRWPRYWPIRTPFASASRPP